MICFYFPIQEDVKPVIKREKDDDMNIDENGLEKETKICKKKHEKAKTKNERKTPVCIFLNF